MPDLATYTRCLTSQVGGHGTPDARTSAACPVAADCVAAHASVMAIRSGRRGLWSKAPGIPPKIQSGLRT